MRRPIIIRGDITTGDITTGITEPTVFAVPAEILANSAAELGGVEAVPGVSLQR